MGKMVKNLTLDFINYCIRVKIKRIKLKSIQTKIKCCNSDIIQVSIYWEGAVYLIIAQIYFQIYCYIISDKIDRMENPQMSRSMIIPKQMYSYSTHKNIPWNITEYELPALHFDQKQIIRQRQYAAQKKGVKANDFYITKRGFYMDYDLKQAKVVPGPDKHGKCDPWPQKQPELAEEELKTARSSLKYSYLERIQMQEKNRPKPGVGQYSLAKSMQDLNAEKQKLKSRKISYGQKRFFFQNTECLSNEVPGMGLYNPHEEVQKLHLNKTNHKLWIDKHTKLQKINTSRQLVKPNPASYSPTSQSYNTFQRTFSLPKKAKLAKHGFGTDSRFPYTRPNKKMIIEVRPEPSKYETKIDWKGKDVSPKKKRWADMLWTGSPPKVY